MNAAELLEKATDPLTTTDLASGGLLNAVQAERFIDLVVDRSVMTKQARIIRMSGPQVEIDKINTSGRVTVPKSEGTDPGTRQVPVFTKVTLDTVAYMTPFEITDESLEDSINHGRLEDDVIRVMATQTGEDLEELGIQGDTGSSDTYLATNEGWRTLAETGHVVTWDGGRISRANLMSAMLAMPDKWQRKPLRWYFNPKVCVDWTQSFADRETVLGDATAIGGVPPPFHGYPHVPVPLIPTNCIGTWGYEAGPELSYGFLTFPDNILYGIQRAINMEKDRDIYRGVNEYAITTRLDFEFEEDDAVVLILNVGVPS